MLWQTARRSPAKVGVKHAGQALTWADVYWRSHQFAQALKAAGATRNSVVAIHAPHSPAQVIGLFGTALADGRFTIVNPLLKVEQIKHQLTDVGADILVESGDLPAELHPFCEDRRIRRVIVGKDGSFDGMKAELPAELPAPVTQNVPTDVSNVIYTSGSTGRPKGVVVPHRTLLDGARIVSGYLKIGPDDVTLSLLPFSFDYGLNQLMTAVYQGARIVLHPFRFPGDFFDELEREQATGFAAVPSLWPTLLHPKFATKKGGFPHLRYLTTAGGPHSQQTLRSISEFFTGTDVIVMYGLTESFRSSFLPFSEIFKRPGSIGKAVPEVELLVLDEDGQPCPPGKEGELVHRGAFITYGYLNDDQLTASKFLWLQTGGPGTRPEPAVRSGDVVSLDEDGFIYFHGRRDAMIKSSGYRISPAEVEEAVLSFAGISNVAVFGLPDEQLGQAVSLAYTTYSGEGVDAVALRKHLDTILPGYAMPRLMEFVRTFPLTPNGKVDYQGLKAICLERKNAGT